MCHSVFAPLFENAFDFPILIVIIAIGCYLGNFLWWFVKERTNTNVPFFRRLKDRRYNYIAIVYKEIDKMRSQGIYEEEKIQKILLNKYNHREFRFMHTRSVDEKYKNSEYDSALQFINKIIRNEFLLFDYLDRPKITDELFKELVDKTSDKKIEESSVKSSIRRILIDKSPENIERTFYWLPKLLTEFVPNPDKVNKVISKTENQYAIFYYFNNIHDDNALFDTSIDKYISCLKDIETVHPNINIVTSKAHSSEIFSSLHPKDKWRVKFIEKIQSLCAEWEQQNKK